MRQGLAKPPNSSNPKNAQLMGLKAKPTAKPQDHPVLQISTRPGTHSYSPAPSSLQGRMDAGQEGMEAVSRRRTSKLVTLDSSNLNPPQQTICFPNGRGTKIHISLSLAGKEWGLSPFPVPSQSAQSSCSIIRWFYSFSAVG